MKVVLRVSMLLAVLLPMLLGACVAPGSSSLELNSSDVPVLRYIGFKIFDPTYICVEKGFCEARGVKVEFIGDLLGGPNAVQAVASGSAEAATSSVPALINANAAGLPVQGVIDLQSALPGQSLQRWFVLKDSPIKSLADVEGHTYGVNIMKSSFHYTTLRAMKEAGVDPSKVDFKLLSFADQIPALINGSIDVAGLMQPYQDYLRELYGDQVRELWNDHDFYGDQHVSLIFVNRTWAKYNPDAAKAFALGLQDSIAWIEANQEEAAQIVAKYTGIAAAQNPTPYHFHEGGRINLESVQGWIDWLRANDGMAADWLKAEDVATNAYLEPAK